MARASANRAGASGHTRATARAPSFDRRSAAAARAPRGPSAPHFRRSSQKRFFDVHQRSASTKTRKHETDLCLRLPPGKRLRPRTHPDCRTDRVPCGHLARNLATPRLVTREPHGYIDVVAIGRDNGRLDAELSKDAAEWRPLMAPRGHVTIGRPWRRLEAGVSTRPAHRIEADISHRHRLRKSARCWRGRKRSDRPRRGLLTKRRLRSYVRAPVPRDDSTRNERRTRDAFRDLHQERVVLRQVLDGDWPHKLHDGGVANAEV